jgi:GTP cyclohydrolase IA
MNESLNQARQNGNNHADPQLDGDNVIARSSAPTAFPGIRRRSAATEEALRQVIRTLGEDPEREGLRDTPKRVIEALLELTAGYEEDAGTTLGRVFHEDYDEMVLVRNIPFVSLCEHHLLPITGMASVAYLPGGRIVGLSKLSRVVQVFARRLQSQERMTHEIASAIDEHLAPRGVAVLINAEHACMGLRGVRTPATMVTSAYRGEFTEVDRRKEFLQQATFAK